MKPSVTDNHATVFPPKRIDNNICYQHPHVNNKQSRNGFYCLGMNQESTQDKCGVFGKERNSDSSENQEDKKPYVGVIADYLGNVLSLLIGRILWLYLYR